MMDRMWEWIDCINRRGHEAENDSTPAHEQTDHTYLFLYRVVTFGEWTRDGATRPATCIGCLNTRDLALTWVTGHENRSRFTCPCGATWSDPLWSSKSATDRVLGGAHILPWVELDPRFDEEHQHLDLTVLQMRYDPDVDHVRRQQEEDES